MMLSRTARFVAALTAATLVVVPLVAAPRAPATGTAAEVIRDAVVRRVGGDADVTVLTVDAADPSARFREARPDPSARLGKPVRFTLIGETGAALIVVATLRVVLTHPVTCTAIDRGHVVGAEAIAAVRDEIKDVPIRSLPGLDEVTGARALRAIPQGATILPGFVALRRAVEPRDQVTVVAASGPIEVTAEFVAVDGGRVGDVIRVMNPDNKRLVRVRIVKKGLVEVTHDR